MPSFSSIDRELRSEIRELGTLLGNVLQQQEGKDLYRDVEKIRRLTKAYRQGHSRRTLGSIRSFVATLSVDRAHQIIRAFHLYFLLANAADEVHRIHQRTSNRTTRGSGIGSPLALARKDLRTSSALRRAARLFFREADIMPVFTAHPTEATRQTVLQKLTRLTQLLLERRTTDPASESFRELSDRIHAHITLLWQTTDLRFNKVTVRDEVLRGQYFFTQVLYDALPRVFLQMHERLHLRTALEPGTRSPLRLGTWIGGDRDGHPFVTPDITRSALREQRRAVLERYRQSAEQLYGVLSSSTRVTPVSPELHRWVRRSLRSITLPASAWKTEPSEIYRWAMRIIHARLGAAIEGSAHAYEAPEDLLKDLARIDRSLRRNAGEQIAEVYVRPLIAAVGAFGFSLTTMDIRDNSSLVRKALMQVFRETWSTSDKRSPDHKRLSGLLVHRTPGRKPARRTGAYKRMMEELEVYRWARENIGPSAVGSFIISNTGTVSDVLGLLLLARHADLLGAAKGRLVRSEIDVVPLFETIDDLRASPGTMNTLFSDPVYRRHLALRGDRQEIMIGYSDSSKDGGIVSSAFELFNAQIRMHEVASRHGIRLTFFHGRGGSVSRGGGPVYESILAQPRETMNGRIKITEQGEMISAKYLVPETAVYSLEVMAAAVLSGMRSPMRPAEKRQRDRYRMLFAPLSDASRTAYVALTRDPHFWEYFRASTPIDIIEKIEIGSRPSSRTQRSSLSSIRAIPWVFSWTQCRQAITGWYGFGTAVEGVLSDGTVTLRQLRSMYAQWPFFRALVRNIEMVLVKTDLGIAEQYLTGGRTDRHMNRFFGRIREEYDRTRTAVLRIKGQRSLLENDPALLQSLSVRNPYLDPISFIQVRFLSEFRKRRMSSARRKKVLDLLRSSVNGIAAGMRNTG